eukprot:CAMPEP_0117053308 /NCGR_PEP_ID=MMETSP0472-20121206/36857_1 /TAXON_ID=693140 ORGANISM="Tiarina fusus, Strain LIS" /NCGR_SAMPLE_ID=MMETSP0472 /ASSEMBLY_ACC=CAM_ASM_000603 /LENGTH=137 /DNA_ID=CAMNT_0004768285 /DNA_START=236 /DNA_END=649 /DNA_ORIENTATION=-
MKIDCQNEFQCVLSRKMINIEDIFEEEENKEIEMKLNLQHDQRIMKFVARGVTSEGAFEFIAASTISFQLYEYPFEGKGQIIEYHAVKASEISEKSFWQKYQTPIIFAVVMIALQVIKNRARNAITPQQPEVSDKEE